MTMLWKGIDITKWLSLYYFDSVSFRPWQIFTHMFMHSPNSIFHILFNMFGLVMFGSILEKVLGTKRFMILFLISGLGAVALDQAIKAWEIFKLQGTLITPTEEQYELKRQFNQFIEEGKYPTALQAVVDFGSKYFIGMVGASGAIYGLLTAFAFFFPNTELMLLFIPIPIKAKYLVSVMIVLDVFLGFSNFSGDNVAHFAHAGGALAGFFTVFIWRKFNRNHFY